MNATRVRVFPVPGGPCQSVSDRPSAADTAYCWLGFRASVSSRRILGAAFCAAALVASHTGFVAAAAAPAAAGEVAPPAGSAITASWRAE